MAALRTGFEWVKTLETGSGKHSDPRFGPTIVTAVLTILARCGYSKLGMASMMVAVGASFGSVAASEDSSSGSFAAHTACIAAVLDWGTRRGSPAIGFVAGQAFDNFEPEVPEVLETSGASETSGTFEISVASADTAGGRVAGIHWDTSAAHFVGHMDSKSS